MSKRKFKEMLKRSEFRKRFLLDDIFLSLFMLFWESKISLPLLTYQRPLNEGNVTSASCSSRCDGGNPPRNAYLFNSSPWMSSMICGGCAYRFSKTLFNLETSTEIVKRARKR